MRHCEEGNEVRTISLLAMTFFFCFTPSVHAKARRPEPGKSEDVYSITKAQPVPIAAKKTKLPLIVYGEEAGSNSTYVPSGYMGDTEALRLKGTDFSAPLSSTKTGTTCLRVQILPKGRQGWVGLYWQTPANNWGKIKGAGYDLSGAETLTFFARGENGGERINQFSMGGLVGPYPDSDSATTGPIRLNKEWTKYTINLKDKDLRHIIGGFSFSVKRADNPRGAVFYVDEIVYRGAASTEPVNVPVAVAPPVPEPAPTPVVPKLAKTVKITVPFETAKKAFLASGRDAMDEIAGVALKYPDAHLLVEGHTDNVGRREINKELSFQRAKSVADYLNKKGVAYERMSVVGHGEDDPVRENDTQEGRMENRRVEVSLVP